MVNNCNLTEKQPFLYLLSRSNGSNVIQTAAYCRRTILSDYKTGRVYDYTSKKNVIQSEIVIPKHSPQWLKNITELQKIDPNKASELLWNSVDSNEKNKDRALACKLSATFPVKLDAEKNRFLCYEYLGFFTEKGMVADMTIHWKKENPYILIILSLMKTSEDGWGYVEKEWTTHQFKDQSQEKWEKICNKYL